MDTAPEPESSISESWVRWIAENRLFDCAPDAMVATMQANGIPPGIARQAIADIEADPIFAAARRHQQLHRKLVSVTQNLQRVWEMPANYATVDKRAKLSPDEFGARYLLGCRPVVLTDVADDWPARTQWTADKLKARFGELMVEIQSGRDGDPRFEENKLSHRETVRFADFVDRARAGSATNDIYLTANNGLLRRPECASLLADVGTLPPYFDRARLAGSSYLWIGPDGSYTPLHHDTMMLFHTQLVGAKRWRLVSPLDTPKVYNTNNVFSPVNLEAIDLARFPLMKDVKVLDVTVGPGETLFLPLGWWHQVRGQGFGVSLSYTCFRFPNAFEYLNPEITDW